MPFLYYISSACESARLHGHVIASKKHLTSMCTQSSRKLFSFCLKSTWFHPTTWRPTPHRTPSSCTILPPLLYFPSVMGRGFLTSRFKKYESLHKCLSWKQTPPVPIFSSFYRRGKHNTESQHEFMIKYDFIKKFAFKIYSLDNDLPGFMFFSSLPCIPNLSDRRIQ